MLDVRKPHWLKVPLVHGDLLYAMRRQARARNLHTVCEEAKCPNISECWNSGTATFMILGDTCTRACRFCHVKTGNPEGLLDANEPAHLAQSIAEMNLRHAVITMVDRDDIPDGGAAHIVRCIEEIQRKAPHTRVEMLAGDFAGQSQPLGRVVNAGRGLDVFAHNVETVRRRTPRVRDLAANYDQSLRVLENAKSLAKHNITTKSSIMLGVGEEEHEVEETLRDLLSVGVNIVTLGQYLQPTPAHLRVSRYVAPEEFERWKMRALDMGFEACASGPLVRSSYKASELTSVK
jgi:lipoic acid synthetase